MAMITPSEGKKFERDPEESNFPTGVYNCKLSRVEETGPSSKYPNGNPRIVFEFTVDDGPYKGKKAVAFIGKTLHKSKEGRESNLVKWARLMGVQSPENGFDPDTLIGKTFQVMCELTPGTDGKPGRAWARQAIAANTGAPMTAPTPAAGTFFDISNGKTVARKHSLEEVRQYLMELLDMGVLLTEWRIKGPDGKILNGPDWVLANAQQATDTIIPF